MVAIFCCVLIALLGIVLGTMRAPCCAVINSHGDKMTKKARYSIGVPVFNQVATIGGTIESILRQTQSFDEIVVSDNYSTDGTRDVLNTYGDKIRVVSPAHHVNATDNWNFTVGQLDCDWFTLLSGDDFLYPEFCEKMRAAIEKFSQTASLVRAGFDIVDENRHVTRRQYFRGIAQRVPYPLNIFEQLEGPRTSFAAFAASKNLWEKVGGFPASLTLGQDWGFWLRMAKEGDIVLASSKPLSQYTEVARPAEDHYRLPYGFSDSCKLYQWLCDEKIFCFSESSKKALWRNRFLRHVRKFRSYAAEDQIRIHPLLVQLGDLAGYNQAEVEWRMKHGRTIHDWIFRRKFRALNLQIHFLTWVLSAAPPLKHFESRLIERIVGKMDRIYSKIRTD